jgi:hypothetical protein
VCGREYCELINIGSIEMLQKYFAPILRGTWCKKHNLLLSDASNRNNSKSVDENIVS